MRILIYQNDFVIVHQHNIMMSLILVNIVKLKVLYNAILIHKFFVQHKVHVKKMDMKKKHIHVIV
jgi:hypothetical protein